RTSMAGPGIGDCMDEASGSYVKPPQSVNGPEVTLAWPPTGCLPFARPRATVNRSLALCNASHYIRNEPSAERRCDEDGSPSGVADLVGALPPASGCAP